MRQTAVSDYDCQVSDSSMKLPLQLQNLCHSAETGRAC